MCLSENVFYFRDFCFKCLVVKDSIKHPKSEANTRCLGSLSSYSYWKNSEPVRMRYVHSDSQQSMLPKKKILLLQCQGQNNKGILVETNIGSKDSQIQIQAFFVV